MVIGERLKEGVEIPDLNIRILNYNVIERESMSSHKSGRYSRPVEFEVTEVELINPNTREDPEEVCIDYYPEVHIWLSEDDRNRWVEGHLGREVDGYVR